MCRHVGYLSWFLSSSIGQLTLATDHGKSSGWWREDTDGRVKERMNEQRIWRNESSLFKSSGEAKSDTEERYVHCEWSSAILLVDAEHDAVISVQHQCDMYLIQYFSILNWCNMLEKYCHIQQILYKNGDAKGVKKYLSLNVWIAFKINKWLKSKLFFLSIISVHI